MTRYTKSLQVDEDFMKEVISQGFPMKRDSNSETFISEQLVTEESQTKIKPSIEKPKNKKDIHRGYIDQYFERIDFSDRQLVYITRETHKKLTDIVNVIGGKHGTIGGYIENIIREHFETHKEDINTIYTSLFKKPL